MTYLMALLSQDPKLNGSYAKIVQLKMPIKTQYIMGGYVPHTHQPRHYLPGGRLMKNKGTNPKTRLCGPNHDGGRP